MASPPPLPSKRRKHPRVALLAQVECKTGGEVYVLPVLNASLGGLFLEAAPEEHPQLGADAALDLALTTEAEPEGVPIRMRGRVVRVDSGAESGVGGFGVLITEMERAQYERFKLLLARAGSARPPGG